MQILKYLHFPTKTKKKYQFLIYLMQFQVIKPNPRLNHVSTSCKKLLRTTLDMKFHRILHVYIVASLEIVL